jgi:hypothetical protein
MILAVPAVLLMISAASPANSTSSLPGLAKAGGTVELSAATEKKKKAPKKMKREKVEYMRSAAPPEPKK